MQVDDIWPHEIDVISLVPSQTGIGAVVAIKSDVTVVTNRTCVQQSDVGGPCVSCSGVLAPSHQCHVNLSNITKACVAVNTSSLSHFVHRHVVQG